MEYPIQQLAKAAGTTSRTLRHYDSLGLVTPSRVGSNGYRFYDDRSLVRLQRVLLLRELGLGLDAIGTVLAAQDAGAQAYERPSETETRVLAQHRELLRNEKRRIEAQIASVDRTIAALRGDTARPEALAGSGGEGPPSVLGGSGTAGNVQAAPAHQRKESLMAQNIFDGFDHTQHKREVEERWGADAYAKSDRWWRELGKPGQQDWQQRVAELSREWAAAVTGGEDPKSEVAQDLAQRHVEWLCSVPGTPAWEVAQSASVTEAGQGTVPNEAEIVQFKEYLLGLSELYVADERFAVNYGGMEGATFVRDALRHYVATRLG